MVSSRARSFILANMLVRAVPPLMKQPDELLGKHTAILGSTGSGKSAAVAAIIHSLLSRSGDAGYEQWNPRIRILDPHNEYSAAFPGGLRMSTDDGSMCLPYWLLNFQEMVALLIGKTEFVATSQANIIKSALMAHLPKVLAPSG